MSAWRTETLQDICQPHKQQQCVAWDLHIDQFVFVVACKCQRARSSDKGDDQKCIQLIQKISLQAPETLMQSMDKGL